jgi:hypothetical protein
MWLAERSAGLFSHERSMSVSKLIDDQRPAKLQALPPS